MSSKINPGWRSSTGLDYKNKQVKHQESEDYSESQRHPNSNKEQGAGPAAIVQLSEEAVNLLKEMRRRAQEEHNKD
ncbi:MAG: hypothetical protein CMO81_05230 [Waddliaceae bacterium]|nr:hypothetical protein [Waddliaceae bacterium]